MELHIKRQGRSLFWRILLTCVVALASGSKAMCNSITIISAEFGVEEFQYVLTDQKVDVTNIVNAVYQKYACIAIPGDQPKFFATDPAPGVAKVVLITIKTQIPGQPNPVTTVLRAVQGADYLYPSNASNGATTLKTLKANMAKPGYVPPGT